MTLCDSCKKPIADSVAIYGMYDCHSFQRYEGASVVEVIDKWIDHISTPIPAILNGREIDDLGPTSLCPAIVMSGNKELRRVGRIVFVDKDRKPNEASNPIGGRGWKIRIFRDCYRPERNE